MIGFQRRRSGKVILANVYLLCATRTQKTYRKEASAGGRKGFKKPVHFSFSRAMKQEVQQYNTPIYGRDRGRSIRAGCLKKLLDLTAHHSRGSSRFLGSDGLLECLVDIPCGAI